MSRHRSSALLFALLAPVCALAQETAVRPADPVTGAVSQTAPALQGADVPVASTVAVTAARSSNRIDRQAYDVKSDAASTNDTVADTCDLIVA